MIVGNGRYEIIAGLARGAFKTVWRANDLQAGCEVALAVLHYDGDEKKLREVFEKETSTIARLTTDLPEHLESYRTRVVELTDHGMLHDEQPFVGPFIATRMVHGRTLREMKDELPMEWRRAFRICAGILEALAVSHTSTPGRGPIIHRDIKPANIIVSDDDTVTVIDFGVAKLAASTQTAVSQIAGTLQYMAPEQLQPGNTMGPGCDIFAVGVILHELLTGHVPWPRQNLPEIVAFQAASADGKTPPLERLDRLQLPRAADVVLRAALAVDPSARPSNALEMHAVLLAAAGNEQLGEAQPATVLDAPTFDEMGPTSMGSITLPDDTPLGAAVVTPPIPPSKRKPAIERVSGQTPPPPVVVAKKAPEPVPEPVARPEPLPVPETEQNRPWLPWLAIVPTIVLGAGAFMLMTNSDDEPAPVVLNGEAPKPPVGTATTSKTSTAVTEAPVQTPPPTSAPAAPTDAGVMGPAELLDAAEKAMFADDLERADDMLAECLDIDPDNEKCRQTYGILALRGYREPVSIAPPPPPVVVGKKAGAVVVEDEPTPKARHRPDLPAPLPPSQQTGGTWIRLRSPKDTIDLLQISDQKEQDVAECFRNNISELKTRPRQMKVALLVRHDGFPARVKVSPPRWASSKVAICLEDVAMGWRFPRFEGKARPASFEIKLGRPR